MLGTREARGSRSTDGRAETRVSEKVVLFTGPDQEEMIGGVANVTLMAADVESTVHEKARGLEFVQEAQTADWGTSAIFKDPDGNQFVLSTP